MKVLGVILVVIVVFTYFFLSALSKGEEGLDEIPAHHTSTGFKNDPYVATPSSLKVGFYLRRFWQSIMLPDVPEGHSMPVEDAIMQLQSADGDSVTWLGHASFLIRESGKTILTDPFLSEFASPVSWAGPRRYVAPGIPVEELPQVDILLISHNHYDHLDEETILSLQGKEAIHVVVPLGLKAFFVERGYPIVTELDWGESVSIGEINVRAMPAVHNSARTTSDRDQTLWAAWAISSPSRSGVFIGDTAYHSSTFKKLGQEYGPFAYAIIPIGAYEPREFMQVSHVNPEEAVTVGTELMAETVIASHWGTISLSDEPIWEPPKRFAEAGRKQGYTADDLWVMTIGETRELK